MSFQKISVEGRERLRASRFRRTHKRLIKRKAKRNARRTPSHAHGCKPFVSSWIERTGSPNLSDLCSSSASRSVLQEGSEVSVYGDDREEMKKKSQPLVALECKRDAYGFAVRPQHLQRYREYAKIYKEEEEERSERWKVFLENLAESLQSAEDVSREEADVGSLSSNAKVEAITISEEKLTVSLDDKYPETQLEKELKSKEPMFINAQRWVQVRPFLGAIEHMMSARVRKKEVMCKNVEHLDARGHLANIEENSEDDQSYSGISAEIPAEDSENEFYDVDRLDTNHDNPITDQTNIDTTVSSVCSNNIIPENFGPWREELESLVWGGLPMALRGELWQAFVGARARRIENYYSHLIELEIIGETEEDGSHLEDDIKEASKSKKGAPEKWRVQIEKDLPRTFPGHPALDEDARSALRRLLTAYARHNPSVGYCQAMNFFAGLLLLMMPEENAFWTLVGIIDEYFDGYYSEQMVESQVDQLVFEELVSRRFPKLVNHLDYLGVEVAWVAGPWFLSIFVHMLPWESVLRVWDVLLFDGNRVMLFRTTLALLELYGPALVTTKDAGDAVTLLQSMAGSTFDSSQLVLTACMGYQAVTESNLQELRNKHRPAVLAAIAARAKELSCRKDSQGLASKFYSFKRGPESVLTKSESVSSTNEMNETSDSTNIDELIHSLTGETDESSDLDLQEQVTWLKVELCRLLEEKRSAVLRAEELETALAEMGKQDNRRLLIAKVEKLEEEVAQLRQALAAKQEQERATLQVLMQVEHEQKVTEDARRFAEQDAAAQRYAVNVLQEKYEETIASLAQMEERVVMAESMLEATIQYQSGQVKATQSSLSSPKSSAPSPRSALVEKISMMSSPTRRLSLLSFGLGWRDRNKDKANNNEESGDPKPTVEDGTPKKNVEKGVNDEPLSN